jgi:tripartite-type tricarboxylate transporter receptor subunit TctC
MMRIGRWFGAGVLAAAAIVVAPVTSAQDWPVRPIRIIVPFAPGGGTDILARLSAPKLSDALHKQVLIENKPGAATILGTQLVVQAPPDGYTFLMVDSTFMINPGLRPDLPYNSLKDLEPVVHLATAPVILVANPALKANAVKELIAEAKTRPGELFYGSGGNGASTHLAGELFNIAAGTKVTHVPFKGTGEAFSAVLANQVPLTFTGISSAKPAVETGRLKALAVTGDKRNDALPDVPTFSEAGLPGVDSSTHWQVLAPANTPRGIVLRLNSEINKVLKDPEILKRIAGLGYQPAGGTPEDLGALIKLETAKWADVIKTAHISIQ